MPRRAESILKGPHSSHHSTTSRGIMVLRKTAIRLSPGRLCKAAIFRLFTSTMMPGSAAEFGEVRKDFLGALVPDFLQRFSLTTGTFARLKHATRRAVEAERLCDLDIITGSFYTAQHLARHLRQGAAEQRPRSSSDGCRSRVWQDRAL